MKNKEVFLKDPLGWQILNNGVSSNNEVEASTLSYELSSFVCEGEYKNGLLMILERFLGNLGKEQAGAWVSGFYGSGKSHLVKVLRYLWTDEGLGKGATPRSLANLPPAKRTVDCIVLVEHLKPGLVVSAIACLALYFKVLVSLKK